MSAMSRRVYKWRRNIGRQGEAHGHSNRHIGRGLLRRNARRRHFALASACRRRSPYPIVAGMAIGTSAWRAARKRAAVFGRMNAWRRAALSIPSALLTAGSPPLLHAKPDNFISVHLWRLR